MALTTWLPTLLSELHAARLKSLAFRKAGRTFSRDRDAYWERFNFQGSSDNTAQGPCRFYVNVGVEFKDLPANRYWSLFANTHWADRLEEIVSEAPSEWHYDKSTDREAVKEALANAVLRASEVLARRASDIRAEYVSNRQ